MGQKVIEKEQGKSLVGHLGICKIGVLDPVNRIILVKKLSINQETKVTLIERYLFIHRYNAKKKSGTVF